LRRDALEFFEEARRRRPISDAPLLPASDGRPWKPGNHSAFMRKAVKQANLKPETVFYSLRHSFISSCVRDGLPILAVAQYCGNSVSIIEKHYGHFQPDNMRSMFDSVSL
jgi:site-specific recombinase XerD